MDDVPFATLTVKLGCGVVLAYCPFIVVRTGLNDAATLLVDEDKDG